MSIVPIRNLGSSAGGNKLYLVKNGALIENIINTYKGFTVQSGTLSGVNVAVFSGTDRNDRSMCKWNVDLSKYKKLRIKYVTNSNDGVAGYRLGFSDTVTPTDSTQINNCVGSTVSSTVFEEAELYKGSSAQCVAMYVYAIRYYYIADMWLE